jgi:cell division GTPase FtsZ
MVDLDIPTLDIEDFDPDEIEAQQVDEIKDEAGGALTYAVIGSGQAGGRIAKAFYDLGYKKAVVFNTAQTDLALLDLPDEHKFHLDCFGQQGAGKNQEKSREAFEAKSQEIFNKMREIFGEKIDRILICVGAAGGTGGGSVTPLVDVAKRYFTYVGKENASERVGVIASLPTAGECASPAVANNAYNRLQTLCASAANGDFAPLILIDNDKIKKLYPKLTVKQFWPTLNNTIAGLFHVFNVLATKDSDYTTFDPADYNTIMKTKGCMIFGVTTVKNVENETSVSSALKKNLEKTLLASGFDLTTAEGAASIVVGGTVLYEEVAGLMDSIEYGFDTLAAITGGAIIHRGIYEDPNKEKLVAYTIVGGLDAPQKRLEELRKFLSNDNRWVPPNK